MKNGALRSPDPRAAHYAATSGMEMVTFYAMRESEREVTDDVLREVTRVALCGTDEQFHAYLKLLRLIGVMR